MSRKEMTEQLESLIEAWLLDEADLNQTDIDSIKLLLDENQQLKEQLKQRDEVIEEAIDVIDKMLTIGYTDEKHLTGYFGVSKDSEFGCRALVIKEILQKYKGDNK